MLSVSSVVNSAGFGLRIGERDRVANKLSAAIRTGGALLLDVAEIGTIFDGWSRALQVGMWHREKRAHAERNFLEIPPRTRGSTKQVSWSSTGAILGSSPCRQRMGPGSTEAGQTPSVGVHLDIRSRGKA